MRHAEGTGSGRSLLAVIPQVFGVLAPPPPSSWASVGQEVKRRVKYLKWHTHAFTDVTRGGTFLKLEITTPVHTLNRRLPELKSHMKTSVSQLKVTAATNQR